MSTKPILFSTPMVRAIFEGRKSQTRRLIPEKIVDEYCDYDEYVNAVATGVPHIRDYEDSFFKKRARYQPGDILWVRETWAWHGDFTELDPYFGHGREGFFYRADWNDLDKPKWRPSIHMPKEAARIFLRVTGVRVERVQDITHAGVLAEGIPQCPGWKYELSECDCTVRAFAELWDSLNAKRSYGWDKNPWVWVYSFERVDKPAGWPGVEVE